MIEISGLSKRYGAVRALDDVSVLARPGRIVGLLGREGAGKSTALRAVVGLTRPSSGEVRILGRRYDRLPVPGRYVGVAVDSLARLDARTGKELLTLALLMVGGDRDRVPALLDVAALTPEQASRRVTSYSTGMRRRLALAHALAGDPQVLILDEPAGGLDAAGLRWLLGLLRRFADQGGTVLLSCQDVADARLLADEIVLLDEGRVLAQGTRADLLAPRGCQVRCLDPIRLTDALRAAGHAVHAGATESAVTPSAVTPFPITATGAIDLQAPGWGGDADARTAAVPLLVDATPAQVGRIARDAEIVLTALAPATTDSLEDLIARVTRGDATAEAAA